MNHYINQLIMYHEIHQQKRKGKQPSQIASFLGMDTRTVKKYLTMSEQEFDTYQVKLEQRAKKLVVYEDFVYKRLTDCTDASSAQVHDWLKECHPDFEDVSIKTVYNFVLYVRNKYRIPKVFDARQYTAVPELPYGAQAQADFGEYIMTDTELHTTDVASKLQITSLPLPITSDIVLFEITVADKTGLKVIDGKAAITVQVEGEGKLIGLDNGELDYTGSFKTDTRNSYQGRLLVAVKRISPAAEGEIHIIATAPGLLTAIYKLSKSRQNGHEMAIWTVFKSKGWVSD